MSSPVVPDESTWQIGNLLSGSWELSQKIFESLSYREVSRARSVCRTWADVGAKLLERRRRLHYLTVHSHTVPTTHGKIAIGETSSSSLLDRFFENIVSKPRYCLAFCSTEYFTSTDLFSSSTGNGKAWWADNMTLSQYLHKSLPASCEFGVVCASGVVGTVESHYQGQWLESAESLNQQILSFLCPGTDKKLSRLRERTSSNCRSSDMGTGQTAQSMQNNKGTARMAQSPQENDGAPGKAQLPQPVSQSNNASSDKLDGARKKRSVGYSIEVERSRSLACDAVAILLVPYHPGLHLNFFHLSDEKLLKKFQIEDKPGSITRTEFDRVTGLSQQDSLKALLLFDAGLDDNFTEALVQAALARQNHKVAVGGGMADCLMYSQSFNATSQHSFGLAISGPNVAAASIVIPKGVNNPKTLVDYMKELKSCGLPEEQSVAFMFTCCGRGYSWYRRRGNPSTDYSNVETKAFRCAFPDTPVFGFFGGGEIGMTHLPKFTEKDEEEEEVPYKRRKKEVFHQFSTIIVLLSFL